MVNPGELVGGAVLGTAFSAVYDGLKELIGKNLIFKSLFKDIKSSLDSLKPIIEQIEECNNELLYCSKEELEDLEKVIKKGEELVGNCLKVSKWNPFKKYKYANKLLGWDELLRAQLEIVKIQSIRDGKKTALAVQHMQASLIKIERSQPTRSLSSKKLELPPLPKLLVGLDVPLKELKEKLLGDDSVSMLVLTAPGGCGKTTLATMFCQDQQVKDKFRYNIYFITVSQKGKFNLIVQRLHRGIPALQNDTHAVQQLQEFLRIRLGKPLLFILDDVWSGSEYILENFQHSMPDYKILVTSRSEFPRFGPSYHLNLLDEDNAMKLFHHSATLGESKSHILEELSRKIVKRCNGFPLAITATGRSLCRQPIEIWKKRVAEWSRDSSVFDSETELLLCLQSSLDALDKDLTECFLDLGLFAEDNEIPIATLRDIWAELYDLDEETLCFANVYELSNRSLATLVDKREVKSDWDGCYYDCFVKQHDLLRELAIYKAKLDPVERRTRLIIDICGNKLPKWWREQKCQLSEARILSISTDREFSAKWPNMQLPEAEVLVLNFQTDDHALPEFVERMDNLKVVVLTKEGGYAKLSNFELLGFLSNLRTIRLERILIDSITKKPMQSKSLRKLSLCKCDMSRYLRTGSDRSVKFSDAFPYLEELAIHNSDFGGHFPRELCDLIHLKKLSIIYVCGLYGLPEEIGNLVNLEELRIRYCIDLPESIRNLKKLRYLELSVCRKLYRLPESIGELSSLRKLDISRCFFLRCLPPSVLDLQQLEEVICDERNKKLWEPLLPTLKNLRLVVV